MTYEEKVKTLHVESIFNELRVKTVSRKNLPKYLHNREGQDILIINPKNDVNDFYNQPLVVIPMNDYLAQLMSTKLPRPRRFRKQGRTE